MIQKSLLVLLALISSGCTTLRPIEASSAEIQHRISSDGLLRPGDQVKIVAVDGSIHEFRVIRVDTDKGLVIGKRDVIPVKEVGAVEKRTLDVRKTFRRIGWGFLIFIGTNGFFCC
jgi:hypothetical protein